MHTSNGEINTESEHATKPKSNLPNYTLLERRVNTLGWCTIIGGAVITVVNPELGNLITGTGGGLIIGGLAVGSSVRNSNN